jgi:hypothetical protein
VSTLLVTLAEDRPLALLIDDLHWADGDTLDLVEQLLSAGEGVPLLGTFRTDDLGIPDRVLAWSVRVRRLANVETLELAALSRAETDEQIRLLHARGPHGTAATESLVDRIYERSRGQPLFTEQLAAQPDGSLPWLLDDVLGQRVEDLLATSTGSSPCSQWPIADSRSTSCKALPGCRRPPSSLAFVRWPTGGCWPTTSKWSPCATPCLPRPFGATWSPARPPRCTAFSQQPSPRVASRPRSPPTGRAPATPLKN